MCANYTPTSRDRFKAARFGVLQLPEADWPSETYPGYDAPIVVRNLSPAANQVQLARFGLVPRWCRDMTQATAVGKGTYNARTETVADKPSFRGAWRDRLWALVPMEDYFEPCWETGHAVRWRIARADGAPLACAGVWERWRDPAGNEMLASFTLLTVNSDQHPLTRRMHRVGEEKRMPVIVNPVDFEAWLGASQQEAMALIHASTTVDLVGAPAPKPLKAKPAAAPKPPVPTTGDLFQ